MVLKSNYAEKPEEKISIETKVKATQIFSMQFLELLTKLSNMSPHLNLLMNEGAPLLIDIPFNGTDGFLQYFLAPKLIEEN